jgi:hypothetical protein
MMRAHDTWRRTVRIGACYALVAAAACSIAAYATPPGRTRLIASGFVALAVLFAGAVHPVRKRLFLSHLGSLHQWVVGHVVIGSLLILMVTTLHASSKSTGLQGKMLYGLLFANLASGLWGIYELRATPKRFDRLGDRSSSFPSTLRRRIAVLRDAIDRDLARRSDDFRGWFRERYQDALEDRSHGVAPCEGYPLLDKRFAIDLHEHLTEIASLRCRLEALQAAERASRRWLAMHVPVTVALVVLVLVHIFGWLYYA